MREHSSEREPGFRRFVVVILPALKVRIVSDRIPPDHIEGNPLAAQSR